MRIVYIFFFLMLPVIGMAQAPNLINYQGVARNSVGSVLPNKNITVRLSIRDIDPNGPVVYSETRTIRTNNFGMFTIAIGSSGATQVENSIGSVDWKKADKFLHVEVDPEGGWNFIDMGISKLLSAPFALHANSASPSGAAGGILTGIYPNPTIKSGAITQSMLAPGISMSPSGTAGGDLYGTYPNPTIANLAINASKLADNAITTSKITNGSVTAAKLAPGLIPTSLPPNGLAGGDLKGNYPSPIVNKIQGIAVSSIVPTNGQVLKFNGTQWAPGTDITGGGGGGGGFNLPYAASSTNSNVLFSISNMGSGASIEGINSSTGINATAILGTINSPNPGTSSSAIRGINQGTGTAGIGIWGSHAGFGKGVYGSSVSGNGLHGSSTDGVGVFATSTTNSAGYFDISNPANPGDAIFAYTVGNGTANTGISERGNGIWGVTFSADAAGVLGYNTGGGEAIVGQNQSNSAAAVVGKNNGSFAGVQGIAGANNGIGVHALANQGGFVNGDALVAELEGNSNGNPALFKANGNKVARIDKNGKGYFNGGTQVGGADVAEYFEVEGKTSHYEPGDVLVISVKSDRKVEKSSEPYSSLVAGVFASKPGIMLTELDAVENDLEDLVPMGVIGVIPTKVCNEGGIISRGDLLVTSSIPGVAMKADPLKTKIGQVIGKALQDYKDAGQGKIKVLVSIK